MLLAICRANADRLPWLEALGLTAHFCSSKNLLLRTFMQDCDIKKLRWLGRMGVTEYNHKNVVGWLHDMGVATDKLR